MRTNLDKSQCATEQENMTNENKKDQNIRHCNDNKDNYHNGFGDDDHGN